jgi:hypothetical protein
VWRRRTISFFNFSLSDEQVFTRFKPSKAVIRRLNLEKVIESSNIKESDQALDFASFLLRYHRNLLYEEFSDNPTTVSRIKRAETFRAWADIEDLALGYERLMNNLNNHQKTASSAFKELRDYCDTILTNQST